MFDKLVKKKPIIHKIFLNFGAIVVTIIGMFLVSFTVLILTGIIYGGVEEASSNQQNLSSNLIIISSIKYVEDELRNAHQETPQLPPDFNNNK